METIKISRATLEDIPTLTRVMEKTFRAEADMLLGKDTTDSDSNILPPGFDSVSANEYMWRELDYYKVSQNQELIGGIIVTITGRQYGRIDRIFINPEYQGAGIGSYAMKHVEALYPNVRLWDLETSARQLSNHHFYEKLGFKRVFETEEEISYVKRIGDVDGTHLVKVNQQLSNSSFEQSDLNNTSFYQSTLSQVAFSNSSLFQAHFTNCNMEQTRFQNINLRSTLFADLNISGSTFNQVTASNLQIENTDLTGTAITNCTVKDVSIEGESLTGLSINGISVEELLKVYQNTK
ncbi:GNAT family N-acetyltransferase [Mangrovibacillus cuniculi]|uniref:GNAT family N-acetyltransferase n=1 Tax=Mangrovibacillus cuniculi TaxID=2593652 RepID=A0A7S8CDP9_9BACI|nr:GNAT family N-acetyltransferase [Mangrovibacillus cuniculi]QPC48093.1 GNAT family N-acetyltransferase [Mangrovibacillus cuniculi]